MLNIIGASPACQERPGKTNSKCYRELDNSLFMLDKGRLGDAV
jgi:hypothetical protein